MKKNIIIAVLSVVAILAVVFGFVQQVEASRQKELADKNALEAHMQSQRAMAAQEEAVRQRQLANECANHK